MTAWPRLLSASAVLAPEGSISVAGPEADAVVTADLRDGDRAGSWSPSTLIVCAVAYAFVEALIGEADNAAAGWPALEVTAHGTLDRSPSGVRFQRFDLVLHLGVADRATGKAVNDAAERAARRSLATHSLVAPVHVHTHVHTATAGTTAFVPRAAEAAPCE